MEAEDLQEELTCSICLDYFQEPVSIECGHNFCRECLHRSWESGGGPFSCPECRRPSTRAALRPNWALARLTEKTRRWRLGPESPDLCGRHREPLRLFCENDQRPVCLVCRESQEHQAHDMAPIDEAFQNYREKLLKSQFILMAKMKKAMHFQEVEVKNAAKWKEKIKNQRMRISTEFSKLHHFLAEEEQLFLQRLSKEEEETKEKLKENMSSLNQMITSLKNLISEVEEKSQASTLELLQDKLTKKATKALRREKNQEMKRTKGLVTNHHLEESFLKSDVLLLSSARSGAVWEQNPKDVLTRSENQDVNYSFEVLNVRTVCQIPMMKEILKRFQVAVNLAEDTAHPKLVISQEGRYVKNGASAGSLPVFSTAWNYFSGWRNPQKTTHVVERFQHLPCVLGKNVFTSGKHYWEVENKDNLEIAVGVCREDVMGITDSSKISPHVGIWAIYWSSAGYRPLTSLPVIPTNQESPLHRVGVYLDHGAGNVSFYSAVDGVHLHTFSCSFVSRLRPFFWLSPLAYLVLPPVPDGK